MTDRLRPSIFLYVNINDINLVSRDCNIIWSRSALDFALRVKSYATERRLEAVEFREGEPIRDALTRHFGSARIRSASYQYTTFPGTLSVYRVRWGTKLEDIEGPIQLSCRIQSTVVITIECLFEDCSPMIRRIYKMNLGHKPFRLLEEIYPVRMGYTQIIGLKLERTNKFFDPDSSLLEADVRDGDTIVFYLA